MPTIDLNADLGEGSATGAWGTTTRSWTSSPAPTSPAASTPATRRPCDGSCALAVQHGVAIGAQVGYRDLAGFGRRVMTARREELTADVYQIGALQAFARAAGTRVAHVKPHGALYNALVRHELQAAAVVEAVTLYDPTLPVLGLPGSRGCGSPPRRASRSSRSRSPIVPTRSGRVARPSG